MKSFYFTKVAFSAMALLFSVTAQAQSNDEQQIRDVIQAYGKAMNAADVDGIVALFAKDAVFMPAKEPTAVGLTQIRAAYEHEFKVIDLEVNVVFDEVVVEGNIAFARTRSNGILRIIAANKVISTEAYRAFFVLKKIGPQWKIARFLFNFTH